MGWRQAHVAWTQSVKRGKQISGEVVTQSGGAEQAQEGGIAVVTVFRPRAGQVVLLEFEGEDARGTCLTGLVVKDERGEVTIDLGASSPAALDGSEVVASVFAPEALYRLHATAHAGRAGLVALAPVHEVERVQRRSWPRRALHIPVTLVPLDGTGTDADFTGVAGRTVDIGMGGMRVETIRALPGSVDPSVMMTLDDGTSLFLPTRVVHSDDGPDGCEYRLAFHDLGEEDAARLAALVDGGQT